MPQLTFDYDIIDNASAKIDKIDNKLKNLTTSYGALKGTVNDLKKSIGVAATVGSALSSGVLNAKASGVNNPAVKKVVRDSAATVNKLINSGAIGAASYISAGIFNKKKATEASGVSGTASAIAQNAIADGLQRSLYMRGASALKNFKLPSMSGLMGSLGRGVSKLPGKLLGGLRGVGGLIKKGATAALTAAPQLLLAAGVYAAVNAATNFVGNVMTDLSFQDGYLATQSMGSLKSGAGSQDILKDTFDNSMYLGNAVNFYRGAFGFTESSRQTMLGQIDDEVRARHRSFEESMYRMNRN